MPSASLASADWRAQLAAAQASIAREHADTGALRALLPAVKTEHLAEIGLWLGLSLLLEALLPQAVEAWMSALDAALANGQSRLATLLWLELATLGREHGDAAMALRLDLLAADLARAGNDAALQAQSALAVAADLFALGENAEAQHMFDKALAEPALATLDAARANEQIAVLLAVAARPARASHHYTLAANRYLADGARLGELRCRLHLAALGDDPHASRRATELAAELDPARLDRAQHLQLAGLFETRGDLASAVAHLDAALAPAAPLIPASKRRIGAVAMRLQLLASRLELAQLRDQTAQETEQDDLSGGLSRAALHARLPALVEHAGVGAPLSLLQVSIDRFGEIRAQRARHLGDDVLRSVAALLRLDRQPGDLLARIGDDEFLLALPATDAAAALDAAESVRRAIAHYDWATLHPALSVSVSIGAASCQPGDSADILLFRADLARYLAQRGGGNRVSSGEGAPE
ncbi:GGDEF domain-containing protein [Jeongeupia naejangsanensis]|uniref:diguanylate cyclase n=1 Tax=Jeongeupia naejangsanensis TaxID=613195 RepID=A0ABS2BR14_9NEIS|nr:GGDEF domain-containing protein [Jeongeupia naejangsanensis]MBM3117503.1 GGDEF domain-containing protein [Jeongeupia naejangsanensis]